MAKGISLHLGLNGVDAAHYAGWDGALDAAEADAQAMAEIAGGKGFDVTLLRTAEVTRAALEAKIDSAAAALGAGDIFLLTYAGHGGLLPDKNGDEDDDTDETWCLHDAELVDDLLFEMLCRFAAGVRVLIVSDSCHSGTVSREMLAKLEAYARIADLKRSFDPTTGALVGRFRGMPRDVMRRTYLQNRDRYDRELTAAPANAEKAVKARVRLLAACQDEQLASDGLFNGLFTSKLKKVWNQGAFTGNYEAFHQAIVDLMPPIQRPNHFVYGPADPAFDAQSPFTI